MILTSSSKIFLIVAGIILFAIAAVYLYCLLKSGSDPKITHINDVPKLQKRFLPSGKFTVSEVLDDLSNSENNNYIVYIIVEIRGSTNGYAVLQYRSKNGVSVDRRLLAKCKDNPVQYVSKLENETDEYFIKVVLEKEIRVHEFKDGM